MSQRYAALCVVHDLHEPYGVVALCSQCKKKKISTGNFNLFIGNIYIQFWSIYNINPPIMFNKKITSIMLGVKLTQIF